MKLSGILGWVVVASLAAGAQTIRVDGQALAAGRAVTQNGRTLVPIRAIFEALGARVVYQGGRIQGQRGDRSVELAPGSREARVNGVPVLLDVPARLVGASTYVPLRFVAESLGARVSVAGSLISVDSGSAAPPPAPTPPPAPGAFEPTRDLKRIRVGNQAGILKVVNPNGKGDAVWRGIDDRNVARYTSEGRALVLAALGITSAEGAVRQLMDGYSRLPKKECLALLGALGAGPLEPALGLSLRRFLAARVALEKDVALTRQAVLALAVQYAADRDSTEEVVRFYERSNNLWETFTVQQYFEYQSPAIRQQAEYPRVRTRVAAVNSLYTPYILRYLETDASAPPQVGF